MSDPALEYALKVRLDFMKFCGFEAHETPDETALCRFRNTLIQANLLERLLKEINRQLEEHRVKVEAANTAIVDATIITSAARPRKKIEYNSLPEDREEPLEVDGPEESSRKDPDALWVKKGGKSYHGYKGFVRVDGEDGFVESVEVTPANEAESQKLEEMVEGCPEGQRISCDKGYTSKTNRELLKAKGLKDGIMHKKVRGKKLTSSQKKYIEA